MKSLLPGVLRDEPQFARLFIGQSLSVLGDRVSFVAVPFSVLSVGGSASDVGLVVAAGLVPMLLFTLVGGVWADRFRRHHIMLISEVVRFAVQGLIAALLLTGLAEVSHLALLMIVFGTADAFFMPASTGLVPLVVAPDRLREANVLRGFVHSSGLVLGPALAGGLIAWVGPGGALALDALTFAVSAVFLARLRPRRTAPGTTDAAVEGTFLVELRTGWVHVRSRTWVLSCMAGMGVYHVVVLPSVYVLGPVLAEREWGGAGSWSVVVAAFGIGAVVGDLCAYRLEIARPMTLAAVALAVASCQAVVIGAGAPLALVAFLEAVTGTAVSLFFVLWETALQTHVPENALSRVSSYDHLLSTGLMPAGLALAGPVSESLGVRLTLYAMTVIAVPAALVLLCVPSVRRLPARAPDADGGAAGAFDGNPDTGCEPAVKPWAVHPDEWHVLVDSRTQPSPVLRGRHPGPDLARDPPRRRTGRADRPVYGRRRLDTLPPGPSARGRRPQIPSEGPERRTRRPADGRGLGPDPGSPVVGRTIPGPAGPRRRGQGVQLPPKPPSPAQTPHPAHDPGSGGSAGPQAFDLALHKRRKEVERTIGALEHVRAVATGFGKRACVSHGTVTVVSIRLRP